jgi:hypothetical protein
MPTFVQKCVQILDNDDAIVNCAPDSLPIGEDGSTLNTVRDKEMVDNDGGVWSVDEERNGKLTSTDVVERFCAVVLHTHKCSEMYGLIRRTALERTSIMPSYIGADKVLLAQLSLLRRYHLLHEPLLHRRFHARQASTRNSEVFNGTWIAGHAGWPLPNSLKMAPAYTSAVAAAELTAIQRRVRCLEIMRRIIARTLHGPNRS